MDLTPYVESLRHELGVAAEAGGEEARALAERLTGTLDSATRLTLLGALSDAMDEVTRDLAPGSVDVRLRGLNPEFVVTPPPPAEPFAAFAAETPAQTPPPPPAAPETEDGATARINFRPPAQLKLRVEEAAGREGLSVNAWLVRAVTAALGPAPDRSRGGTTGSATGQGLTGWVR